MNCFSNLWNVKLGDFGRGFVVAILSDVVTLAYETVSTGSLAFDWKKLLTVGLAAGFAYLLKNWLTGANGKLLTNK